MKYQKFIKTISVLIVILALISAFTGCSLRSGDKAAEESESILVSSKSTMEFSKNIDTIQVLLPTGWTRSRAWKVNENDLIVGDGVDSNGTHKGFTYDIKSGTYTEILPPGWGGVHYVEGINDNGDVVGREYTYGRGFIYHGSSQTYTELLVPGWQTYSPSDINNNGDVVGQAWNSSDNSSMGYLYSGGTYTKIIPPGWNGPDAQANYINDDGVITGGAIDNGTHKGFIYDQGNYTTLISPAPGITYTNGGPVNELGDVVVTSYPVLSGATDFIYSNGIYTPLLPPGWDHAGISDINDHGDAVGYAFERLNSYHYSNGIYTELSIPGLTSLCVYGLNNNGIIVGDGYNSLGQLRAFVTVVPQPTPIEVAVDIKPQSCPNPLNVKSKGVLPVAVLGSENFDVSTIDLESITLARVAPIRFKLEDVSTPISEKQDECDCTTEGGDGFVDLTMKFDIQEVANALGVVADGEELILTLTGKLLNGTPFEGEDCVVVLSKLGKQ